MALMDIHFIVFLKSEHIFDIAALVPIVFGIGFTVAAVVVIIDVTLAFAALAAEIVVVVADVEYIIRTALTIVLKGTIPMVTVMFHWTPV